MTTTEELLQEAIKKVRQARELVQEAKKNESLDDYYGYSLILIDQYLDIFSSNEGGYVGNNTSIEDVLEGMGEGNWENKEHDYEFEEDY